MADLSYKNDDFDCKIDGPCIMLTKDEKERIRRPWKNTLIVKLLGRSISYTYLSNKVKQLWSLKGGFDIVDLENGFYCIRFQMRSDYNFVLTKGLWIIADHYLIVKRWVSGFRSDEASIETVATWVPFLGMPLEFYDGEVLRRMGDIIGKAVRIDRTTSFKLREKITMMCVELA
ncbi:hypothetical protein REPUB_Repub05bG0084100 [Reevesia pubescens]